MKFYVNNVESLEEKLHLRKRLKKIRLSKTFSERRLKDFLKKIPSKFDRDVILSFENETGIILKYLVHETQYDMYEYTSLGIYPNPEANVFKGNLSEFNTTFLKDYDILVEVSLEEYEKSR